MNDIVLIRGGGDLATGVIQSFVRAGCSVLILETDRPTSIRRTVSLSEAVYNRQVTVEDITSIRVETLSQMHAAWEGGNVPLAIDPKGKWIQEVKPLAVIDAIIAKKNLGTHRAMAPITIGVGPGFCAGEDVDIVVESNRGHQLGRLILEGCALANTGVPGAVKGYTKERVIYSVAEGIFTSTLEIGATVQKGDVVGEVSGSQIYAEIDGLLRGILRSGMRVPIGFKVGDIDPRLEEYENCFTISDKARSIGNACLNAFLLLKNRMLYV